MEAGLAQISEAIDEVLLKAGRKQKALRNFHRLARKNERKLLPKVREWMKLMVKEVQAGLPKMRGRKAKLMTERLADWEYIKEQGTIILKSVLLEILADGGDAVVRRKIIKQERFDPIGVAAVTWAEEHAAELVTMVSDETVQAIRSYIADGVNKGKSVQKIARELRPLVGLTEKQLWAVANYEEWLIENRPEYTARKIRDMADVRARKLHRRRATTIARTETSNSLNEGIIQGYGQMGIKKVEWVADPEACEICAERDGNVYTMEEVRSLERHPNCECTLVAA